MTGALREQWIQMTGALSEDYRPLGFITPGRLCSQTRIGNVSGYRCVSDCRSRGREFDPDPVPYFRGDCGHSPPSADLFKKGCCQLQAKVCAQITG